MSYTPTLFDISSVYGEDIAVDWVTKSVCAIWFLKPDTNPLIYQQARRWAASFVAANSHYKIGEMMLFFARCNAGRYNLGYNLDVTRIGLAFEDVFKRERHEELARYENEEQEKKRDILKEEMKKGVSWDEYVRMKCMDVNTPNPLSRLVKGLNKDDEG